ncbi:MAG: hypothetical protein SLAVMIC_00671 [uncultured marine phage]|uniref:Uncharacterized protein n=1 Tax=uncultured marine phage TaxID=707152 RepID=A0A8D9CCH8_9VIRU|nr:MAG: hypothetical protein SLAVMIC_00671 [uncultured marine phage]
MVKSKKNKDSDWYDAKMKDLKKRKREACSSVSDSEYGSYTYEGGKADNKTIKKLKQEFKKEKRSYKRAEKQNWKQEAQDIIDNIGD